MSGARRKRRFGLAARLNAVLIACILLIALGLLQITYKVYSRKVNSLYLEDAQNCARAAAEYLLPYDMLPYMREWIDTDEFRQVRARALEAGDEGIIRDWMIEKPASPAYEDLTNENGSTLYGMYTYYVRGALIDVCETYSTSGARVLYWSDGTARTLADTGDSLLLIGEARDSDEALSRHTAYERVQPVVYRRGDDWLITAGEPVVEASDGTVSGLVCVDIDMNGVFGERRWFLVNTAVFAAMLTLAAMAASMLLMRKLATGPLKQLADEATGFARAGEDFSREDVVSLPIRSNDEIGDLYREIRSMQGRIVDNADRLTKIAAERERVRTELGMAAQIQASALPMRFPAFPDRPEFDLYASMDPAKEVGGDFYDFFLVDDDHLAMVIADVSDKGVPAALFMMSARNLINCRAMMGGSPAEILASVNGQLCKDNGTEMFVTVWLGILELATGRLTCANAGHECPFVRSRGRFSLFRDRHGIVVGAMAQAKYTDYALTLESGDAVFVYTDGVPEANDAAGGMYGMDRLELALGRLAGETPEGILRGVRADVDAFVDGARQFDDLTMLCVEYRGPAHA